MKRVGRSIQEQWGKNESVRGSKSGISTEYRGEVACRMQNANHPYARTGSSVEEEIIFESSDRYDAHACEVLSPKVPDTPKTRQRHQLRIRLFQCRHKPRCC